MESLETIAYRVLRERLAAGPGRAGVGDFALRNAAAAVAEEFRKAIGLRLEAAPPAPEPLARVTPMLRLVPNEPKPGD